uniref:Myelin P2 protein-like n=1 Tax=Phallusia mammillata TaxID=59560 RepID=A0A6F9DPP5_9ASCI|nr:myelin P2 protein-like [Phallusia mammillata]
MKAVGVNIALRKMGAIVNSTSEISDEGNGKIRINTQSTFKSANVLFPVGEEITESTMDGRTCKTTINWDGPNKLHQVQKWDNGKREATLDWIFQDGGMVLHLECDGVICDRYHSKC